MASSSDNKGKSLAVESIEIDENEILSPTPISYYIPDQFPESTDQACVVGTQSASSLQRLRSSTKIGDSHLTFTLTEEQVAYIGKMDEVTKRLAEDAGGIYSKGWCPISERLEDWRVETRQRNESGKVEMFYKHPKTQTLRSMRNVCRYICYGFIPKCEETKNDGKRQLSSASPTSIEASEEPQQKKQRSKGNGCVEKNIQSSPSCPDNEEEKVKAFLEKAYDNLMNLYSVPEEDESKSSASP